MFSLYALLELLCVKKKKLHCAFIDFEKAFDFVQRNSLFLKLIKIILMGNFIELLKTCIPMQKHAYYITIKGPICLRAK